MDRQRIRIRFRKEGDLRWISHRDLVRAFERLFRRAGIELGMSEGFHPKPRMTFPSALALGIAGAEEVMEFEVAEDVDAEELKLRIARQCPPGLCITELRLLAPEERKARVERVTYSIPIPPPRCSQVQAAIEQLRERRACQITRDGESRTMAVCAQPDDLTLRDGVLAFRLAAEGSAAIRPRELLAVLGLADLEQEGDFLTRAAVELASLPNKILSKKNTIHENGNADQRVAAGGMPYRDR